MKLIKSGIFVGWLCLLIQTAVLQSTQPISDRLPEYNRVPARSITPPTYEETRLLYRLPLCVFNQPFSATNSTYVYTVDTNVTSAYPTLHGLTLNYELLPRTYLETGISILDDQSVEVFTSSPLVIKQIHFGAAFRVPLRIRYQLLKLDKKNQFRLSVLATPVLEISHFKYTDELIIYGNGIPDIQHRNNRRKALVGGSGRRN